MKKRADVIFWLDSLLADRFVVKQERYVVMTEHVRLQTNVALELTQIAATGVCRVTRSYSVAETSLVVPQRLTVIACRDKRVAAGEIVVRQVNCALVESVVRLDKQLAGQDVVLPDSVVTAFAVQPVRVVPMEFAALVHRGKLCVKVNASQLNSIETIAEHVEMFVLKDKFAQAADALPVHQVNFLAKMFVVLMTVFAAFHPFRPRGGHVYSVVHPMQRVYLTTDAPHPDLPVVVQLILFPVINVAVLPTMVVVEMTKPVVFPPAVPKRVVAHLV